MSSYLPSAHKTQVEFRSHFSGKKVRLMGQEIRYLQSFSSFEKLASSTSNAIYDLFFILHNFQLVPVGE
jgi:hypothetical protein